METGAESRLARIREVILRERLLEVIAPRGEVRIRIRLHVLVDVRGGGEIRRVTPDVLRSLRLVYAHVVDAHRRWEGEQVEVDSTEGL